MATERKRVDPDDAPYGLEHGHLTEYTADEVEPIPISWLWPNRIALGALTFVIGDPQQGKSHVTWDIVARVTAGLDWPDGSGKAPTAPVYVLNAEDDDANVIVPGIIAAGGNREMVHFFGYDVRHGKLDPIQLDAATLTVIEDALAETESRLLLIDPLGAFLPRGVNTISESDVRAVLHPLTDMAKRARVAVVAVMHLNKATNQMGQYRQSGSVAFRAVARSVWGVAADPMNPARKLFAWSKGNLTRPVDALAFRLEDGSSAYYGVRAVRVAWESGLVKGVTFEGLLSHQAILSRPAGNSVPGPSDGDAEEASQQALDEAAAFLKAELANGPVRSAQVEREARQNGVAPRTLDRARRLLKVVSERRPDDEGRPVWWMRPPDASQEVGQLCHTKDAKNAKVLEGGLPETP